MRKRRDSIVDYSPFYGVAEGSAVEDRMVTAVFGKEREVVGRHELSVDHAAYFCGEREEGKSLGGKGGEAVVSRHRHSWASVF